MGENISIPLAISPGIIIEHEIILLQDEPPNDRKIGKLCEYASKNPMRIPKVIFWLPDSEQKENFSYETFI